jgi:hypothetical protein
MVDQCLVKIVSKKAENGMEALLTCGQLGKYGMKGRTIKYQPAPIGHQNIRTLKS